MSWADTLVPDSRAVCALHYTKGPREGLSLPTWRPALCEKGRGPLMHEIFFLNTKKSRTLNLSLSHAGPVPLVKLYKPFCTAVSISVKWEQPWAYLTGFFIRIKKVIYAKLLKTVQYLAQNKCSTSLSLYFSLVNARNTNIGSNFCCLWTFR